MLPVETTFDYVGMVPEGGSLPWVLELKTATERRSLADPSLAGPHAWLTVEDAGLTPNAGYHGGIWRPEVLRARLRLSVGGSITAARAVAHLHVDFGLVTALQPRDLSSDAAIRHSHCPTCRWKYASQA